jgi:hypothetical protein
MLIEPDIDLFTLNVWTIIIVHGLNFRRKTQHVQKSTTEFRNRFASFSWCLLRETKEVSLVRICKPDKTYEKEMQSFVGEIYWKAVTLNEIQRRHWRIISFSIVTGQRIARPKNLGSVPRRRRCFSLLHSVQTRSRAKLMTCPIETGGLGVKNTHLHVVQYLRMSGAVPSPPLMSSGSGA